MKVEDWDEKPLDRARFEEETGRRNPWYANNETGEKSCFAVCPGCDNPIQIIGFYRRSAHTPEPYARHYGRSIRGLSVYRQFAYDNCPYSAPRRYDRDARRSGSDPLGDKILDILVPNFDRVIYLLEQDIGLKITAKLAEQMLIDYRGQEGHQYMGATLQNVPWVFAYMTLSKSLVGRRVPGDEAMLDAVEKTVPGAVIDRDRMQVTWRKGQFVEVDFCFIHHRARHEDGNLRESMKMVVSHGRDNAPVYSKVIEFDRNRFRNLVRTPAERATRPRREELVGLAEKILGSRG
ncbi:MULTISPECIES: hypothetical protein [unclassified Modicisalibacter]|uniref:hypothetical protein n=1 Tax=unclassified Modicisalibacter TaxID=2679913 RepID=UPI001CD03EE6|nr:MULTISPECIES: hypothetical protein [unclassified Modicisalibacter]MBZ9559069.1 hypothetical protein [Modicisalibacter sp. R2A 31.J]MBZ9576820.1 hypothetical protein [Modicisalibacter sp. MOD 31.J]